MKTDDLIAALSADARDRQPGLVRGWWLAVALSAVAAGLVYASMLAPRPDIAAVAMTARFLFKFLFAGALAGAALASAVSLSRPGGHAARWLLAPPLLLAVAVLLELASVPASEWGVRLVGRNSMACLVFIPLIGLLPLAVLLAALRRGAPSRPTLAGAVCGLMSGGVAALFYATHCPDDSPLFVATWYSIAVLVLTTLGALGGRLFVRW